MNLKNKIIKNTHLNIFEFSSFESTRYTSAIYYLRELGKRIGFPNLWRVVIKFINKPFILPKSYEKVYDKTSTCCKKMFHKSHSKQKTREYSRYSDCCFLWHLCCEDINFDNYENYNRMIGDKYINNLIKCEQKLEKFIRNLEIAKNNRFLEHKIEKTKTKIINLKIEIKQIEKILIEIL